MEAALKGSKFGEAQVALVPKQAGECVTTGELYRKTGISWAKF